MLDARQQLAYSADAAFDTDNLTITTSDTSFGGNTNDATIPASILRAPDPGFALGSSIDSAVRRQERTVAVLWGRTG